ncbi:MAG: double-strand break repair protein AddB, partial [Hyphomicrobiales bacterium]
MTGTPKVFTCPAGMGFLDTLAQAVADGTCPGTTPAPDWAAMPDFTIRLPTRRAIPALAEAFRNVGNRGGLLLPNISALGDEDPDTPGMAFPEVVSELERRIVLADIARAWAQETSVWSRRSAELGPDPIPQNPADAVALAGELAQLIDAMESQDIDHAKMVAALPEDLSHLARNWEINRDFLKIAIQRWDAHLRRRNLVSAVSARDRRLDREAERVAAPGFAEPYIVAGSTGSVPATARLLGAVARAQNGAVVLPGLDRALDSAGWDALEPGHPQFGLRQVIDTIGVSREQVADLGDAPTGWVPARLSILSEAMRPAVTTGQWVHRLETMDRAEMARGLDGVKLIEAANEHEEAGVVALILRNTVEQPGKTAALVTPDRGLARRVRAELGRWDLTVDDSAGTPLAQTPPGVFLQLLAQAHDSRFSALALLCLLKHPLTRLGRAPSQVRKGARHLEIIALRGARPGPGLAGVANALRAEAQKSHRHPVRQQISATDIAEAEKLLDDLKDA